MTKKKGLEGWEDKNTGRDSERETGREGTDKLF